MLQHKQQSFTSAGNSLPSFWITSGFCITAPTQPSAIVQPSIRPCSHCSSFLSTQHQSTARHVVPRWGPKNVRIWVNAHAWMNPLNKLINGAIFTLFPWKYPFKRYAIMFVSKIILSLNYSCVYRLISLVIEMFLYLRNEEILNAENDSLLVKSYFWAGIGMKQNCNIQMRISTAQEPRRKQRTPTHTKNLH